MDLVLLALGPVFIIVFYLYARDKYEKEPIGMLLKALMMGVLIIIPVIIVELLLNELAAYIFHLESQGFGQFKYTGDPKLFLAYAGYEAFVVAGFTEEVFKYLAFMWVIWRNKNFNEHFDGIIYAAFISLGFAAIENIFYVLESGVGVGLLRALTAVPAHALFGVTMGYYFSLAKFGDSDKSKHLFTALWLPIVLHGAYDFCLMSENTIFLLLFLPFIAYLWYSGFKRIKKHSDSSIFKEEWERAQQDKQS